MFIKQKVEEVVSRNRRAKVIRPDEHEEVKTFTEEERNRREFDSKESLQLHPE